MQGIPNRATHSPVLEVPETFLRLLPLVVVVIGERLGPGDEGPMPFSLGPRGQKGYLSTQVGVGRLLWKVWRLVRVLTPQEIERDRWPVEM